MSPTSPSPNVLVVDLGGTNLRSFLISASGEILKSHYVPSPDDADAILDLMTRELETRREEASSPPLAIGVSTAGLVERSSGVVRSASTTLGTWRLELGRALRDRFDLPTVVENDGNCGALAEAAYGGGTKQDLISVVLGTGIGGGIVVDGQLLRGPIGAAAEFGHVPIAEDGPGCSCGRKACAEAFCSGRALGLRMEEAVAQGLIPFEASEKHPKPDAPALNAALESGEPEARRIVSEAGVALGRLLAGQLNVFPVPELVLSGSVLAFGEALLSPMKDELKRACLSPESFRIRVSTLEEGPARGAALLAHQLASSGQADLSSPSTQS